MQDAKAACKGSSCHEAQRADLNVVQDICKPGMHSEGLKHLLAVQQGIHHLWVVPQA